MNITPDDMNNLKSLLDVFAEMMVEHVLIDCKSEEDFAKEMLQWTSARDIKALKKVVAKKYPQFQKKFNQLSAFQ